MVSKFEEQKNKFGVCVECNNNLRTDFNWCSSCDCAQLVNNFNNWTSGNDELDKLIQHTQSTAKSYLSYLEWIPYERFENIKLIGAGSLSSVYSAVWKDGERIHNYWDDGENSHIHERSRPIPVALKRHYDTGIIIKILSRHHVVCMNSNTTRKFIQHYGVTKDPVTSEFVIVMQYANDGSLKDFLFKNKIKHDWQWKLNIFRYLAQDLSTIHNAGLTHQDVKDENVYIRDNWAYISQLCWSVSKEEIIGGENEFKKRKASDIYGFGGVMRQIAIDSNRYYNPHDETKDIPSHVLKLIKSCLDDDFRKRPDINKILYILEKWCGNPQYNQFESL